MKNIELIPQKGNVIKLNLYRENKYYTVEEILSVDKKVYEDIHYEFNVQMETEARNIIVFVNNEKVNTVYDSGKIIVQEEENKGIFFGLLGFVQISLHIFYDDTEEWYYSEYASVMVRSNRKFEEIDAMLKYIYENQDDILKNTVITAENGKIGSKSYDDFWAQILMLQEIANIYESSFGYFKANSRCKLETVEVVDRTDKLQQIDAKTVQYIAQHPENLKKEASGIRFGKQTFLPDKALMLKNRITQDIYENQVVLGFLGLITQETSKLQHKIEDFLSGLQFDEEDDEYIISSHLIYLNASETLKGFLTHICKIEEKMKYLFVSYRRIFLVKHVDCTTQPKPTAIFLSVPQYNRIYTCILKWFTKSGYEFKREKAMMYFYNVPAIYEVYVLIKLLHHIQSHGYKLINSQHIIYPQKKRERYQSKQYNNTFTLKNGDVAITVYYEPVIYDADSREINGIGIYRNNTTSLTHGTDEERSGHYYVPDYLVKLEVESREYYIICDAKYSWHKKVKSQMIPELTYKYLFSLSSLEDYIEIKGLNIFYGIVGNEKKKVSFYDRENIRGSKIKPFVNMIPLAESIPYEEQDMSILQMFQELLN